MQEGQRSVLTFPNRLSHRQSLQVPDLSIRASALTFATCIRSDFVADNWSRTRTIAAQPLISGLSGRRLRTAAASWCDVAKGPQIPGRSSRPTRSGVLSAAECQLAADEHHGDADSRKGRFVGGGADGDGRRGSWGDRTCPQNRRNWHWRSPLRAMSFHGNRVKVGTFCPSGSRQIVKTESQSDPATSRTKLAGPATRRVRGYSSVAKAACPTNRRSP